MLLKRMFSGCNKLRGKPSYKVDANMTQHQLESTIPRILAEASRHWADRLAIVDEGLSLSFQALQARAQGVSKALIQAGLEPGEPFAIWAPNSALWIVAALGGQLAGGVLVPINTRFKAAEAADVIRRSKSRFLFIVNEFLGTSYPRLLVNEALPDLAEQILLDSNSLLAFIARGKSISQATLNERSTQIKPGDLSDILYTSGTTGRSKGVMSSHGQNIAVFTIWSEAVGLNLNDRYLIVSPFFHTFGYKAGWLAALLTGACIYPLAVFDPGKVLHLIETEAISMLPGAPTIFQSLLAEPQITRLIEAGKLTSLRCAVTGAASVPVQLVKDMKHRLGFKEVYTAYGLTESTGVVSLCHSGDDLETIAKTSGRAMRGVELQITDPDGQALAPHEQGEIWVRGFNVMQGYLDDEATTAATITADGWLKTGDLGLLDEGGYLKITDRLKDMYICGGFNCYPAEIEQILLQHPDIKDVAVVGVADEQLGEVGHAYLVAEQALDPAEIISWAREAMANYKVPRGITQRDDLPRNASGKVQKYLLKPSPDSNTNDNINKNKQP